MNILDLKPYKYISPLYGEFYYKNGGYECDRNIGYYTYQYRKKEYIRLKVWSLDVWGNENDGFEVNDRSHCDTIFIPRDCDTKEVVKALKANRLLNKYCKTKTFDLDGDESSFHLIATRTGEPIYQLEAI